MGTTEFCGLFSSGAELQSLIASELRNIDSFAIKGAMMREIEETLAEVTDLGPLVADIFVKHAFFHFIEMALTDMIHHGLMNKLNHNSFER